MNQAQQHRESRPKAITRSVCTHYRQIDKEFFSFDVVSFRKLIGPGIYVVIGRGQTLYVGMAKNVLARMTDPAHAGLEQAFKEPIEQIFIMLARSEAHARQMEADYIRLHQPKYNQRGKYNELERLEIFKREFTAEFTERWLKLSASFIHGKSMTS